MNSDQLKPCPFCGGFEFEFQYGTEDREGWPINVVCTECGACGPRVYSRKRNAAVAMAAWQKRFEDTDEAKIRELVETSDAPEWPQSDDPQALAITIPFNVYDAIGGWLSAALDDPKSCDEFKTDIHRYLEAEKAIDAHNAKIAGGGE